MGLFGDKPDSKAPVNKKQIFKQELKEGGAAYATGACKYLGGHPEMPQACDGIITINKAGLFFEVIFPFKGLTIPLKNIKKAEFKNEEQIHKDVTLGRLLLFGVFAFGLKKKTKELHNYLVLTCNQDGIESTVIFEAKNAGALVSAIVKAQQEYKRDHPEMVNKEIAVTLDIPEQIKKLAELKKQGILSEEEFQIKKRELLSKI